MWSQTVYDTTGDILTNTAFANPVKKTLQVHVCRNITKAMSTNCSSKGLAPVYMASPLSLSICFPFTHSLPYNISSSPSLAAQNLEWPV